MPGCAGMTLLGYGQKTCLARMAEQIPGSSVFTLDGDFRIYRKHGRQVIPLIVPERVRS
jgi:hypothetical protein